MILKADHIAELLDKDNSSSPHRGFAIVPKPNLIKLKESGSASIDLRLGSWFVTSNRIRMTHLSIEDQSTQEKRMQTQYIRFGDYFILHPGAFALGVTIEWLHIPNNFAGYVIGKSSWGRRGLIIATATGVHPGFTGCLTLELSNVGDIPITIQPGISICQLFLHQVDTTHEESADKTDFAGYRKPTLGTIKTDDFYTALSVAYDSKEK